MHDRHCPQNVWLNPVLPAHTNTYLLMSGCILYCSLSIVTRVPALWRRSNKDWLRTATSAAEADLGGGWRGMAGGGEGWRGMAEDGGLKLIDRGEWEWSKKAPSSTSTPGEQYGRRELLRVSDQDDLGSTNGHRYNNEVEEGIFASPWGPITPPRLGPLPSPGTPA